MKKQVSIESNESNYRKCLFDRDSDSRSIPMKKNIEKKNCIRDFH